MLFWPFSCEHQKQKSKRGSSLFDSNPPHSPPPTSTNMDDDVAALVVDNGSGMCKVSNQGETNRPTDEVQFVFHLPSFYCSLVNVAKIRPVFLVRFRSIACLGLTSQPHSRHLDRASFPVVGLLQPSLGSSASRSRPEKDCPFLFCQGTVVGKVLSSFPSQSF